MKILTQHDAAQLLAKSLGKPIVLIHFGAAWEPVIPNYFEEVLKAAPYLKLGDDCQIISDGSAVIICEDEEECRKVFDQTVGDDGPTDLNPYNGPVKVYALTINAKGEFENENT
jgi:hypothetical protein